MSPFVHIFLGHERDRFEITPVISSNVEYVAFALCGRLWGTFLGYLKENLDKFQGKQVLSHSFPKMKRPWSNSVAWLTPLLPWRVQCPVRVCAALAAGSGGSGRYLVLCLSRFPHPAPRVPRCVWRAVPSVCPLPSLAGTPFPAVCAFRVLGLVALLVVPACPLRVCALALPRRPLPPPLGGPACAPRAVPTLGAGRAVQRGPCPSACPAPVPCCVWRASGGAVRSRFPPTWLLLRRASEVRRSPSPNCPPPERAVGVRYPRAVGAGVWLWGPNTVCLACMLCGGCVPQGWCGGGASPGGGGLPLL